MSARDTLTLLHEPQPPPIESVLTILLNDLGALASDIVLVLDDYHVIDAHEVQEGMVFLLDHLPSQLHLVIAGRADPALPLARLRARGELTETRAAELRFTPGEAAAYLNETMGLALTAPDVAALEGRTEGWIAALQLAALSIQGRDDVAEFISGFAGDDRYIVDYLAEEVLQRQPQHVRDFLLQTCILDRLNGPLCDAVTGKPGGKAMLEALDRSNLFLVPLDDRRRWYRYHHLFADVLRARLLDEQHHQVPDLHRRASVWHEQHGEQSVAIGHALAGKDFQRAADLVEVAIPAMRQSRQDATLRGWVEALPDDLIRVAARAQRRLCRASCCSAASSKASSRACTMPSDGCTPSQAQARDARPPRRQWSWWPTESFAVFRVGSPSTGPPWRWRWATWLPPWHLRVRRSDSSSTTTISGVERPPGSWDSRRGRVGTWRQRTGRMSIAWRVCGGQGICPTPSVLRSRWRRYGSCRVGSATRCAPARWGWSLRRPPVALLCEERQTFTSAWPRSTVSGTIYRPPRSIC